MHLLKNVPNDFDFSKYSEIEQVVIERIGGFVEFFDWKNYYKKSADFKILNSINMRLGEENAILNYFQNLILGFRNAETELSELISLVTFLGILNCNQDSYTLKRELLLMFLSLVKRREIKDNYEIQNYKSIFKALFNSNSITLENYFDKFKGDKTMINILFNMQRKNYYEFHENVTLSFINEYVINQLSDLNVLFPKMHTLFSSFQNKYKI